MNYIEDHQFEKIDFSIDFPVITNFENCEFVECELSALKLNKFKFINCRFYECNLSNSKIVGTSFQNAHFNSCKLLGLRFDDCNPFGLEVSFEDCNLDHSSFFKVACKKMEFKNCELKECDFSEADLSGSSFHQSNLLGALFSQTNLESVDFVTAQNIELDLDDNKVTKAKFDLSALPALILKYKIEVKF